MTALQRLGSPQQLCIQCERLIWDVLKRNGFPKSMVTPGYGVTRVPWEKCGVCRKVARNWEADQLFSSDDVTSMEISIFLSPARKSVVIKIPGLRNACEFGTVQATQSQLSLLTDYIPWRETTQLDSTISTIKMWMSKCKSHPSCSIITTQLPRRVLDVQADNRSRLRLLVNSASRSQYLALSHRWGKNKQGCTVRANYKNRLSRLDESELPRSFTDAIRVTRLLGFRYLWIDSLCIIQDDLSDWEREAPTMGTIYESAYLTISASESTGDHQRFLEHRSTPRPFSKVHLGSAYQSSPGKEFVKIKHHEEVDLNTLPITSRAWVFQERFFSTRTIHFCKSQAHWECQCRIWSESGRQSESNTGDKLHSLKQRLFNSTFWESYNDWTCLVERYSRCQMTLARDKLPAISGIMTRIHEQHGTQFIAGHITEPTATFLKSLAWGSAVQPLRAPSTARCSSWSWAALDGPLTFYIPDASRGRLRSHLRRIYKSADALAATTHLLVHARTAALHARPMADWELLQQSHLWGIYEGWSPGAECNERCHGLIEGATGELCGMARFDVETRGEGGYVCMALFEERSPAWPDFYRCWVLVLEPVLGRRPSAMSEAPGYRRVGIGCVFREDCVERCREEKVLLV